MSLFRQRAVEGAPNPVYPDVVNRIFELYHRNLSTIDGDSGSKKLAAIRDTAEMVKGEFENVYPDVALSEDEVRAALEKYYNIKN